MAARRSHFLRRGFGGEGGGSGFPGSGAGVSVGAGSSGGHPFTMPAMFRDGCLGPQTGTAGKKMMDNVRRLRLRCSPKRKVLGMSLLIAIVDDEREVCDLLRILFESRGYKTVVAHNGVEGLALVRTRRPAAVLLDLKMPGMNGLELVQALKKDPELKAIPAVLMSAITRESGISDTEWARSAGADGYLAKPFDPMRMLDVVEELLRRR